jgi:hypothetical protein
MALSISSDCAIQVRRPLAGVESPEADVTAHSGYRPVWFLHVNLRKVA